MQMRGCGPCFCSSDCCLAPCLGWQEPCIAILQLAEDPGEAEHAVLPVDEFPKGTGSVFPWSSLLRLPLRAPRLLSSPVSPVTTLGSPPKNFNFVPCLSVAKKVTWNSPVSSLPPLKVYRPCSEISLLSARYHHSIQACFVLLHDGLLSFTGVAFLYPQIEGKTLH